MKLSITKLIGSTAFFALAFLVRGQVLAAPFTVGAPTPSTTFINQMTIFSSTIGSGGVVTIDHCRLSIDGSNVGDMTLYGGTSAFFETAITTSGSHVVATTCYDALEANSNYKETLVTVWDDASAPFIHAFVLTPTSPIAGTPVNIAANYDDTEFGSGIDYCKLYIDSAFSSNLNLSAGFGSKLGTADQDHTFATGGTYSVKVDCMDLSGNLGTRTESVTVTDPADTTPPTVGILDQSTAIAGTSLIHTGSLANSSDILDRKSTRLNSSHTDISRMPSSA